MAGADSECARGLRELEQFEQIQQAIASNDRGGDQSGAVQNGPALLAGLLRCHRCGRKLTVRYSGNQADMLRYACHRGFLDMTGFLIIVLIVAVLWAGSIIMRRINKP